MTDPSPLTEQELDRQLDLARIEIDALTITHQRRTDIEKGQRMSAAIEIAVIRLRNFRALAARVTPEMLNGIHGHGDFHGERTKAYALLQDLREAGTDG